MQVAPSERCSRWGISLQPRKGEVMKKLFALIVALLAAIGAATVVFFWRKNHRQSWDSSLSSARDTASSWTKTAVDQADKAAHRVAGAADDAGDAASMPPMRSRIEWAGSSDWKGRLLD